MTTEAVISDCAAVATAVTVADWPISLSDHQQVTT
jgi:hypothetical protein